MQPVSPVSLIYSQREVPVVYEANTFGQTPSGQLLINSHDPAWLYQQRARSRRRQTRGMLPGAPRSLFPQEKCILCSLPSGCHV